MSVTPAAIERLDRGRACFLVTGAPGAGKSTVTRALSERLTRSALMDSYDIGTLVRSGYVWPLGEPAEEAARQVELVNANLCALARNFADARFTPIIDHVVPDADQLGVFRRALARHGLLLVVLDPGQRACRHRNESRPAKDRFFFDGYEGLRESMTKGFGGTGWWFDTSGLSAEETVERILLEAPRRARIAA